MEVSGHILIVMGPCACGKSEVGTELAKFYDCPFIDADALHSESNISKMGSGIPLTDEDRIPWLNKIRSELMSQININENSKNKVIAVTACSALKKMYRDILRGNEQEDSIKNIKVIFVFLDCSREVLKQRLAQRTGHFMKIQMLDSQLNTLQRPEGTELSDTIIVNGDLKLEDLIPQAIQQLNLLL